MHARTQPHLLGRLTSRARNRLADPRLSVTDPETGLPGRTQLRADLEASVGPRTLQLMEVHAGDGCERQWVEADPELPRRIAALLVRAVEPLGAQTYSMGGLLFAILGPPDRAQAVDLAVARQALAGAAGELGGNLVHGDAHLPQDAIGAAALSVALSRLRARSRRQGRSAERQVRDVLLALLRERREGGSPISLPKVGSYAVFVGRTLGLSLEELDEIVRAAELQDLGKLVIPESILTKRGSLTEEEWRIVRTHPLIAERVIASAPALSPVATLVRASAERWDGTGYPDGLKGEAIPLGSRIIAVCDAYDAMISDRPYRLALAPAEALAELRLCSGKQFDPVVVEVFGDALRDVSHRSIDAVA
jgi:two-component system cell cycle response regulator